MAMSIFGDKKGGDIIIEYSELFYWKGGDITISHGDECFKWAIMEAYRYNIWRSSAIWSKFWPKKKLVNFFTTKVATK